MEQVLPVDNSMSSYERNDENYREYPERTRNPLIEKIKSMFAVWNAFGASIVSLLKSKNRKEKRMIRFPLENVANVVVSIIANNRTADDYLDT